MEMFYLAFLMHTYSTVIIPEPYLKDACEVAGKSLNAQWYACVPAPKSNYCKYHYESSAIGPVAVTKKVCD